MINSPETATDQKIDELVNEALDITNPESASAFLDVISDEDYDAAAPVKRMDTETAIRQIMLSVKRNETEGYNR